MLSELLPAGVFAVLLVFARMGSALMILPGIGDGFVAPRIRLLLGVLIALLVAPVVSDRLPAMPPTTVGLVVLLLGEVLVGLFFGTLGRVLMGALTTAGMVMAYMSTLANALVNDPTAQQQGSIAGSFLTVTATVLIFALNLHHLMLAAVVESYELFTPGALPPVGDLSELVTETVAKSFLLGIQMAAPFIAVGLTFYLGLGLLARLMPQVQVFFVAIPLQITLGLVVLLLSLPIVMQWFMTIFEATFRPFVGG